jgi:hypothetical protein
MNGYVASTSGSAGKYFVEYTPIPPDIDHTSGFRTPTRDIDLVAAQPMPVSEPLTSLPAGRTYLYRVCAEDEENPSDPFRSPPQRFRTDGDRVDGGIVTERLADEPPPEATYTFTIGGGTSGENAGGFAEFEDLGGRRSFGLPRCLIVAGDRAVIGIEWQGPFLERTEYRIVQDGGPGGVDRTGADDQWPADGLRGRRRRARGGRGRRRPRRHRRRARLELAGTLQVAGPVPLTRVTRTSIDVVEQFVASFDRRWPGEDELSELFAPGVRFIERPNLVNPAGSERDLAAIHAGIEAGRRLLAWQSYEVRDRVVEGETVVTRMRWTGELAVDAGTWPAGTRLAAWCVAHYQLSDGRIVRIEQHDCYEQPAPPAEAS